jgi:NADPH-dependent glutamate synthase beta subunit-like oxidoreductase
MAGGRVGVVGGGNSAVDAARTALRQKDVKSVTIFYRRTQNEMPAFAEEVEAAVKEGVRLEILTAPSKIVTKNGKLTGIELIRNRLGEVDASGRRKPIPIRRSEFPVPLDTLIVAISEGSETDCVSVAGANRVDTTPSGTIRIEPEVLTTNRPGVFAGGDVVTGPNTVVDAIAAGKKAAVTIDRYLSAEPLVQPAEVRLPKDYIELPPRHAEEIAPSDRAQPPTAPIQMRRRSFTEVEMTLAFEDATREAMRCLRCDLAFTQPAKDEETSKVQVGGAS